ncbi:MAG: ABC transporter ATP-binding protein [bacterium]
MSYAIETYHIKKEFPRNKRFRDLLCYPFSHEKITALEDISITVNKGEVFCLLGPNGAGKTTLIKILCTLILPSDGHALVNGHNVVVNPGEVKKTIGYVISEERSFYWRLTAYQNLKFFGILNNIPPSYLVQRIEAVLKLVGLSNKADVMFKDYSLGMKQKLAIARAFLTEPEIIFMDEPTQALDPSYSHFFRQFISEKIVGYERKTVFLATHNLKDVEEIGHRIAIINKGKIEACGTPGELNPDNLSLYDIYSKFIDEHEMKPKE